MTNYGTGVAPMEVAIGDMNEDGRPDLVVLDKGTAPDYQGSVSILVNRMNDLVGVDAGPVPPRDPSRLAVAPPSPNPTQGILAIAFVLESAAPARLEVLDVAGRVVALREVGAFGVGSHRITFSGVSSWSPGIYFIRLSQGRNARSTKVCILR